MKKLSLLFILIVVFAQDPLQAKSKFQHSNTNNILISGWKPSKNFNNENKANFKTIEALKKFKRIDAAVLCSYPTSKGWGAKLEQLKEKNLYEDLNKQLGSTIIFSQRIMKFFLKNKNGNLILVSSIQGIQPPKFEHYSKLKMSSPIEYSAVKAGIISITRYLSKYFKKRHH